jgi:ketosteroid isomerase-like protein
MPVRSGETTTAGFGDAFGAVTILDVRDQRDDGLPAEHAQRRRCSSRLDRPLAEDRLVHGAYGSSRTGKGLASGTNTRPFEDFGRFDFLGRRSAYRRLIFLFRCRPRRYPCRFDHPALEQEGSDDACHQELVKRCYEAFGRGDIPGLLEVLADDIKWHVAGRSAVAGDYEGHQGVIDFFTKLMELSGGTFQVEVHDFTASDDHVVVLTHETAERDAASLDGNNVHAWHVGGGKATEFWGTAFDQYAWDEFWT